MNDLIKALTMFWFVVLSVVVVAAPKTVGTWQAQVEEGFFEEAERIGLWEEETY
jgi:hypothetical protein